MDDVFYDEIDIKEAERIIADNENTRIDEKFKKVYSIKKRLDIVMDSFHLVMKIMKISIKMHFPRERIIH